MLIITVCVTMFVQRIIQIGLRFKVSSYIETDIGYSHYILWYYSEYNGQNLLKNPSCERHKWLLQWVLCERIWLKICISDCINCRCINSLFKNLSKCLEYCLVGKTTNFCASLNVTDTLVYINDSHCVHSMF